MMSACYAKHLPIYPYSNTASFPAVVMELSDHEIKDWYTPNDFKIGMTILIYNRPFLVYDCDEFTKSYLNAKYNMRDFTPVEVSGPASRLPKMVSCLLYKGVPVFARLSSIIVSFWCTIAMSLPLQELPEC